MSVQLVLFGNVSIERLPIEQDTCSKHGAFVSYDGRSIQPCRTEGIVRQETELIM